MSIKILFVDDQSKTLTDLREALKLKGNEWQIYFADSGSEALALMADHRNFDFVVSDIVLKDMDGAELLEQVQKEYPQTLRIAASEKISDEVHMRAMHVANFCVFKPYDAKQIYSLIERSYGYLHRLKTNDLRYLITELATLPCDRETIIDLQHEVNRATPNLAKIKKLAGSDIAVTTKLLQLINSAYYATGRHFTKVEMAIDLLGLEPVQTLVNGEAFYSRKKLDFGILNIAELWRHSSAVSELAGVICAELSEDQNEIDSASLAGLLHDVGRMILAADNPKEFRRAGKADLLYESAVIPLETRIFGADHATLGAAFCGVWGFAEPVVHAIQYHHRPWTAKEKNSSILAAVYLADCLVTEFSMKYDNTANHEYINSVFDAETYKRIRKKSEEHRVSPLKSFLAH